MHPDISEIEKKHRNDNYKNLLPFLSEDIIKKYIALLITLVIMEEKRWWYKLNINYLLDLLDLLD